MPSHGIQTRVDLVRHGEHLLGDAICGVTDPDLSSKGWQQLDSLCQALIDQGMSLQQAVAAKPTAEWDDILGKVWITPEQWVTFIYNSLEGIHHYTPAPEPVASEEETDR